jgi:hypothetical protein
MRTQQFSISYTRFNRVLFKVLGMGRNQSGVTVSDSTVRVHMGWGFDGTIARNHIVAATHARKPWWRGWGVHGWSGSWVVNGSDDGIVKLTINPPAHVRMMVFAFKARELYVSLEDPDGFLATLNAT